MFLRQSSSSPEWTGGTVREDALTHVQENALAPPAVDESINDPLMDAIAVRESAVREAETVVPPPHHDRETVTGKPRIQTLKLALFLLSFIISTMKTHVC